MDVSNYLSDMPDFLSSFLMNHCLPAMPSLVCQRSASLLNKSCKEKNNTLCFCMLQLAAYGLFALYFTFL